MAQEKPNPFVEWILLIREQAPLIRRRFELWLQAVRDEPVLLWATPAIRYFTYTVAAVVLAGGTLKVARMVIPPPPAGAKEQAQTADFHVVCSEPQCAKHFVIHRPFGFNDFPMRCPKCERSTGWKARPCNSKSCRGRWVAPFEEDGSLYCPVCDFEFE